MDDRTDCMANVARERAGASFNSREMLIWLDGSQKMADLKLAVARELEADSFYDMDAWSQLTMEQKRVKTAVTIRAVYRRFLTSYGDEEARRARVEVTGMYSVRACEALFRQCEVITMACNAHITSPVCLTGQPDWQTRMGVHFGLFCSALQSQGSTDQVDKWMPRAMTLNLFGCFAMTELRGGTNVKALETTATYFRAPSSALPPPAHGSAPVGVDNVVGAGEGYFEIHTPSVTALKWWIGGAADTATHAAVYAQLVTPDGARHGVHVFVVQLRDPVTGRHVAGVETGDVGPKMGRNGIDNGFIRFNRVRVPRSALLCKYGHVEPDGRYVRDASAKPQLAYGALIMGRASMVQDSASALQLAATIAVRWAVARRQGTPIAAPTAAAGEADGDGAAAAAGTPGPEPQLLDYATHQAKLIPLIAAAYAFNSAAARMRLMVDALDKDLASKDASALPDVHASSSGLKAFCTWGAYAGIETARASLGGHGYSHFSRLPQLLEDFAVQCSWEGDNTVMALQTARYLIAAHTRSTTRGAAPLAGSVRYLTDSNVVSSCPATAAAALQETSTLLAALRWRARSGVLVGAAALAAATRERRLSPGAAWNDVAPMLVEAARAHIVLNVAAFFGVAVEQRRLAELKALGPSPNAPRTSAPALVDPLTGESVTAAATSTVPVTGRLYPVLKQLLNVYILGYVIGDAAHFLRHGYLTSTQLAWAEAAYRGALAAVRPDALALVDSFGITDFVVGTPLGRADGDVYRAYVRCVKAAIARSGGEGSDGRATYFEPALREMFEGVDYASAGT